MVKSTKKYEIFKFRSDNREEISKSHVNKLVESIRSKNLLELRPILVNGKMEVIDGQHRLEAAKILEVTIYYEQKEELVSSDIILMNTSRSWKSKDFLNFYVKNNHPEYIKLQEFMKRNRLHVKVAINLCMGKGKKNYQKFQNGEFVFNDTSNQQELDICWETIDFIKKMNGHSPYLDSSKFWIAILKLVTHENFNKNIWMENLKKMVNRICNKASTKDYDQTLTEIYNYRQRDRINLGLE